MDKINKNIFILSMGFFMLTILTCRDSFLDVAPTSSLGSRELSSKDGLEGALIGAYSMLLSRMLFNYYADASNWVWGSILGGDANKGTSDGDAPQLNEIQTYTTQSNNRPVQGKYNTLYEGISRTNATLRLLLSADENVMEKDRVRIEAEAKFLRAHYYFELKKNFNNTPYVDEFWDEVSPVPNDQSLWPFIEADFEFAYEHLPTIQIAVGRANKWAAGAYLAKVYLFQNEYQLAKPILDLVIAEGTTSKGQAYGLVPYYADVFRSTNDNSEESVFAAQAAVGTGSDLNTNFALVLNFPHGTGGDVDRPGGCCGFFQPSFDLANSFRTNEDGLPLPNDTYNDQSNALLTDMGLSSDDSSFVLDKKNVDPRLDHSIGRRGIPYLDWGPHPGRSWIRDQVYGGPYSPKKFSYYKAGAGIENESSWASLTAVNYKILRFADVLLMAAEVEIELGNLEQGREYINRVRSRAKDSPIPDAEANYVINLYPAFNDQAEARAAVRFERKLELSGEGHRFYDLVRWGIAKEVLDKYLEHENQFLTSPFAGARFTSGKSEYLPIPQDEIDLQGSDVLKQNPGY